MDINQPLTTVHVSTERSWQGGEQQARLLAEGLIRRGHQAIVLARRGGAFAQRMQGVASRVIEFSGSGRGIASIWQMRRLLAQIRPDIIHFHDAHALTGAGMAAWRLGIGGRIAARKVTFPIRSPWKYCRLADRVIAVSGAVAAVCRTSGIPDERIEIVYDGVDPARLAGGDRHRGRAVLQVRPDQTLLLAVGSLNEVKGHRHLLQAMPAVLKRRADVCLAVAGDGPLLADLQAESEQLNVAHAVQFLGYRHDVPDLLKAADLFVLPSLAEGLCSTLLDAMFARLPFVATRAGGIPEVVGNADMGDAPVAPLVTPGDAPALAQAIVDALDDVSGSAERAQRAFARASQLFHADRMVDETLAVYRRTMAFNAWRSAAA